jgi:hypothetical protein
MAHDIFVSHSNKDKIVADAVVAHLEREGMRCWCAPRDILSGASWASSIIQAINGCKAMVIVFSANANQSDHIHREVERAVNHGIPVVPMQPCSRFLLRNCPLNAPRLTVDLPC